MITICSLWTPELKDFGPMVEANHRAYAEKHGYKYHCLHSNPTDRPPAWGKIPILLSQMDSADWLFWIDADAIFTNFNKRLEEFIVADKDFIAGKNFDGLNSGLFLLSTSQWSRQWLVRIYGLTQFINHQWWEQAAMMYDLRVNLETQEHSLLLPYRTLQTELSWKPGDFAFHPAGRLLKKDLLSYISNYIMVPG